MRKTGLRLMTIFAGIAVMAFLCQRPLDAREGRVFHGEIGPGGDVARFFMEPDREALSHEIYNWETGGVRKDMAYDGNGVLRSESYYREDNETLEHIKKYDAAGHVTGMAYFSSQGRLSQSADGWAAARFEYDNGILATASYYRGDGRMYERKVYDDNGTLMAKQYIGDDNDIDPDEEYNPRLPLNHEVQNDYYDEYGKHEATTSAIRE